MLETLIVDLTIEESRVAEAWLASPVHNTRADLRRLYAHYRSKMGKDSQAAIAWSKAVPGVPFDPGKYRLLRSYLLRCLEEWLAYTNWERSNKRLPGGIYLTRAYRQRGLDVHLRNRLLRRRNLLTNQQAEHPEELLLRYELEKETFTLAAAEKRLETHNLSDLQLSLDTLIVARKLRLACQVMSSDRLTGQQDGIFLLAECMERAERKDLKAHPAIRPYYLACKLLMDGSEVDFEQYFNHLLQRGTEGSQEESRDLLYIALNYCVGQINRGEPTYLRRAFELYRLGVSHELLYEHGKLSNFTFSNIVGIGLRLNEIDWVIQFVRLHEQLLPERGGREVYALNAARLAYAQGAFREALTQLQSADFKDLIHHLSARTLQLKIYWELDYQHLLGAHLKNTRALLNRRKNSSYHVQNYRNIFSLASSMYRLSPNDGEGRQKLIASIQTTEPLTEREWLLDRAKDRS